MFHLMIDDCSVLSSELLDFVCISKRANCMIQLLMLQVRCNKHQSRASDYPLSFYIQDLSQLMKFLCLCKIHMFFSAFFKKNLADKWNRLAQSIEHLMLFSNPDFLSSSLFLNAGAV